MSIKGQNQVQDDQKKLYDSVKRYVWVLRIEGETQQRKWVVHRTAFAVGRRGYLLTCAHGYWYRMTSYKIMARPLYEDGYEYEANVVMYRGDCEMCLMRVPCKLDKDHVVSWGDGNVEVGQTICLVGHPSKLVGTFLVGRAAYPCSAKVKPNIDDGKICVNYSPNTSKTPSYRVMGHIWNKYYFGGIKAEEEAKYGFEKNLLALLPVIQCANLIDGPPGAFGGPIFNIKGEVVGMLVSGRLGYQIGVHVRALSEFVKVAKPYGKDLFKGSKRESRSKRN